MTKAQPRDRPLASRNTGQASLADLVSVDVSRYLLTSAFFDGTERLEEPFDVLLVAQLRNHADENLSLVSILGIRWFHLNGVMHAGQDQSIVQNLLSVQRCLSRPIGDEAAAFRLSAVLIT